MKDDRSADGCSTGESSFNGFYKNLFNKQTSTPICMFYFAHPFGISTPSSTATTTNVETQTQQTPASKKKNHRKSAKYTTTTYLVTEIQKNVDESSQDECCEHIKPSFNEREMIPWPTTLLLPPPIIHQLMEKKQGHKLTEIDALLRQVRKQAWNTPKSHQSHNFWSRGSSISSDDFTSISSSSVDDFSCRKSRKKQRRKMDKEKITTTTCKRQQIFLKRRYSVPEIIMRKYSLAQQRTTTYEESTTRNSTAIESPSSCCDETIKCCRNGGQSSINIKNSTSKFLYQPPHLQTTQQSQSQSSTRVSSPIKYFIPLSPQSAMSPTSSGGVGGNFFLNGNTENISMRKQALLRRMWSREFQHTKYSGSWSPPLKRVAHRQKHRLEKFHTLPEVISSSSCEKCRELGVLGRSFDEDISEAKEDKSQQTDDFNAERDPVANQKSSFASSTSSASTIIRPIELKKSTKKPSPPPPSSSLTTFAIASKNEEDHHSKSIIDSNGNNIIICMTTTTTLQDQKTSSLLSSSPHSAEIYDEDTTTSNTNNDEEISEKKVEKDDMLSVEIDGNNNKHHLKLLKKQFSTQIEENKPPRTPDEEIYKRLREDKLTEEEIDAYISRMLIDNLNNVIRNVVNENLKTNEENNLVNNNKNKIDLNGSRSRNDDDDSSCGSSVNEEGGEGGSRTHHEKTKFHNEQQQQKQRHEMLLSSLEVMKKSFYATTSPPENGDTKNIRIETTNNTTPSFTASPLISPAVHCENSQNVDVVGKTSREIVRYRGQIYQSLPDQSSNEDEIEVAAVISAGTSYPIPSHPETIFVPRVLQAKTESMEVNPSSSSALDDDEFDDVIDSGEEEEYLSDVDSIDGFLTIRESKKLSEFGLHQHRKAQALFKPIHMKGQAFFVPIVDTEQPIDEHIVVADTMPEKLREKLTLRQRRRDIKKQTEMKIKQWQMEKMMERKLGEVKLAQKIKNDFNVGGAFKILGMPQSNKLGAISTNIYRRDVAQVAAGGGWMPRNRQNQGPPPSIPPTIIESAPASEKSSEKSIKITTTTTAKARNGIGNLESYKIDGRGNMQIQNPATKAEKSTSSAAPLIKTRKAPAFLSPAAKLAKLKSKQSEQPSHPPTSSKKQMKSKSLSNLSSKRTTPTHAASSNNLNVNNAILSSSASSNDVMMSTAQQQQQQTQSIPDVRRRQVMKDVQQMSIYKNDLTPDPDSGPSRKMWKTEIKEGDKHIEILEIVECVEGTASSSTAPEHFNFSHSYPPPQPSSNHHKIDFHVSSSSSTHPTIVNKTFSVKTTTTTTTPSNNNNNNNNVMMSEMYGKVENPSRIPIPVYRYAARSKLHSNHYQQQKQQHQHYVRDKSPYENNYSSSTDESLTSAGSSITNQPQSSTKVDRMIANLLMEALKSPEIEYSQKPRRSQSPNGGADSSSTGYYTGDSSSRRSASNSAGKYQHRFEVIPEEKSSYTMESSNDDFIDDDEEESEQDEEEENLIVEKLNEMNNNNNNNNNNDSNEDWKSHKDLRNNDIKTRSSTPNKLLESEKKSEDDENEKSNQKSSNKSGSATNNNNNTIVKTTSNIANSKSSPTSGKAKKVSSSSSSTLVKTAKSKKTTSGGESSTTPTTTTAVKEDEDDSSAMKSEDAFFHALLHHHPLKSSSNHFMTTSSPPSSTSNKNNHFHYHLYQYQTHNCCFNLLDHSKTSSTVTSTAASNVHENFTSTYHRDDSQTQSFINTPNHQKINNEDKRLEDKIQLENIIDVELTNKNYHKDDDKCSCTKKYLPYKVNEKNVWQVYETSDCKYIQSKYEVNEIFQPPSTTQSGDHQPPTTPTTMLYSHSNFSDRIIYQARNQDEKRESTTSGNCTPFINDDDDDDGKLKKSGESSVVYTHSFNNKNNKKTNIKSEAFDCDRDKCKCVDEKENGDDESSTSAMTTKAKAERRSSTPPTVSRDSYRQSGKLLNRPKATNNISRDQVKPVEKEIQNEITKNGGVKKLKTHNNQKPICLPSPTPKQPKFDDNCGSSAASSITTSEVTVKENHNCNNTNININSDKDHQQPQSLIRQDNNKIAIPSIHQQGWSVTVAGTHPDLAPDVEMKLSFPKASTTKQQQPQPPPATASTINSSKDDDANKPEYPEVFFYKNNQLLPADKPPIRQQPQFPPHPQSQSEFEFEPKPYYNHRRSLSLARELSRIDSASGMSANSTMKPKSYLPNLHVPRATARNAYKQQVQCTTISASKTIIPSRRSLSLDVGSNRRTSLDSREQVGSPFTPSEMFSGLSVVGSEIRKNLKPRVKTMSERDLTKRHINCFTRSNGYF